ncbi:hypothetical protein PCANC_10675 [Puccinia coronata f. sp. avenae]|uniref:Uncharacterized protein n=1 Tax=Puccinia coronata f. sp. avenae TaxID=200324 RepID=A0A2N5U2W1_9BASI|nr:hypothetical protein PCANC_24581 [Puccinia coronata f. sp. avenae]PLW48964.1 hypothetical protein PCANC_10675 [Puccinia coronata f. sp. avenae]
MSLQLPTSHRAPSKISKNASRKQKRRRTRSSSIFTSTSADSTRANEELATAKAAAMKLLDQPFEQQLKLQPLLDQAASLPASPKSKKIRFADVTTIKIVEEEDQVIHRPSPPAPPPISKSAIPQQQLHASCQHHPTLHPHAVLSHTQDSPPPIIASSTRKNNTSSLPQPTGSHHHQQDTFQVCREEIFADTAIVDAFQAAMNEFLFDCFATSARSGAIRLPQSHTEERRTAALYYGKPPPGPSSKSKKPALKTIFLPRPTAASFTDIQPIPDGPNESGVDTGPRQVTSPVDSDLDMDEYWDMVQEGSL